MSSPKPVPEKYDDLFADIGRGKVKIPQFQREFVWPRDKTAKLIDSILKEYPIGTFIFWKTRDKLKSVRDIGNINLPEPPEGESITYILDGQQRIASLFAVRAGAVLSREGEEIDYKTIFINLDADPNEEEEIVTAECPRNAKYISVFDLLNKGLPYFYDEYTKEYINRIDQYKRTLETYDFPTIQVKEKTYFSEKYRFLIYKIRGRAH